MKNVTNTADETAAYDPADISANKLMGILAYLEILVLIPIFCAKNSPFARFHANQGLVLFITSIVVSIISGVLSKLPLIGLLLSLVCSLVGLVLVVLLVIGILNVLQGKAKELPIIGSIRILK